MKTVVKFLEGKRAESIVPDRDQCWTADFYTLSKNACCRIMMGTILALCLLFLSGFHGLNVVWGADEGYPTKPIKLMVPFAPGSHSDVASRILVEYLSRELKVPVIIENKDGAGGLIGAGDVHRGKADGYTVLGCGDAVMTIAPLLNPNPPFDPLKDFLPICSLGVTPFAFGVHKSSPFKNLTQFIEEAKARPGQLSVGVPNIRSINQMVWEVLKKSAGISAKLVPHKGTPDMMTALLGRHIDMGVLSYSAFISYVKSGEIRILATTFPVPGSSSQTVAQAGYPKTVNSRNIYLVPAKTPRPIYERLVTAFERVAKNNELKKKLEVIGLISEYEGPSGVTADIKDSLVANAALIKELGL